MEVDRPTTNGPETIIHGGTFNSAGRDIIYNIQNVQTRIEAPHDSSTQELQKMLDWLSLINFRDVQAINYNRYAPETVRWFLEGEMFETFLKSKRSVICGTGMPGAGKTTLAAAAVKEAQEHAISNQTAVNFVYCRYTDPLSVEEILAAMVRQLVEDHAAPSRKELVTLLTELIGQFEAYNCFLDGLDEAVLESQETLLNTMKSLPSNLLVTTRPLGFLEDLIPDATFFKVAAATEDIERLVSQKIQENSRLHKLLTKHGIKDEVVSKIRDTANGIVMEKLEGLPISLNEMYSLTLERILSQPGELADLAKRVLCWVVYAKDPLTLEAIKNAVSSHTGNSPFDVDAMEDEETLISVCFGLVVAEDPGNMYTLDDGEIVPVKETRVKLIHYTAQDALESLILNKLGSPHALLAEACVTYLTGFAQIAHLDSELDGLQGMEAMEHVSSKYPFYHYAWLNLGHHCKEALQLPTSAIDICSTRRFILSSCPYPMLQVIGDDADYAFDVAMSPIHIAAWYNMLSIFNDMVDDNGNVTLSSADNISGVEDHFDFLGLFKDVADKEDALQAF
ncbi:hypothetical protein BKA70DRAFT_1428861 [Coprinopsis sp. MPI-PUGE-AT-0042]|nr:hypothetical protein BKA70DRAFT_1428861 [Coprinopsis sp. MPI-PUGE-AT-0042]